MHQTSWVHRHLQCLQFAFDPGWRRHRRQWCIGKLFAGHFQDDGAYHKWRVHLWRRRAVRVRRRRRRSSESLAILSLACNIARFYEIADQRAQTVINGWFQPQDGLVLTEGRREDARAQNEAAMRAERERARDTVAARRRGRLE